MKKGILVCSLLCFFVSNTVNADGVTIKNVKNVKNIAGFTRTLQEIKPEVDIGYQTDSRLFLSYNPECQYGDSEPCYLELFVTTQQYMGDSGEFYLYSIYSMGARDTRSGVAVKARTLLQKDRAYWDYNLTCDALPTEIVELQVTEHNKSTSFSVGLWVENGYGEEVPVQIVHEVKKDYSHCKEYLYYFLTPR